MDSRLGLDDSGVWPSVELPKASPSLPPFRHCSGSATHTPSQNNFKTVAMTWMNGRTNSPMAGRAFLRCAARKGSAKDLPFAASSRQKVPEQSRTRWPHMSLWFDSLVALLNSSSFAEAVY